MMKYRKDDALGHRCVQFQDDVVLKHFPDEEPFQREFEFWSRAAAAGVAPTILDVREDDDGWVLPGVSVTWTRCLSVPRMTVLTAYLRRAPGRARRVGDSLVRKVLVLHDLGIAHRDLHAHNVIVDSDGQPYVVDWEFAVDVDGVGDPYDLYGSVASGVVPPWPHQDARPDGIFWDCDNVLALGRHVGPLERLLPNGMNVETNEEKRSTP